MATNWDPENLCIVQMTFLSQPAGFLREGLIVMGTHDMSPCSPHQPPIKQKQKWCLRPPHHTHRFWELCAKIFTMTFVQTKVCKNISRGYHSCQIWAISGPNDCSPFDPKWGNTLISVKWKISENIIWQKYTSLSSSYNCHLGILGYFWREGTYPAPSKLC